MPPMTTATGKWNGARWQREVESILCRGAFDRAVALLGAGIAAAFTWRAVARGQGTGAVVVLVTGGVHALLFALRRPPKRVAVAVLPWAIALAGSQWHLLFPLAGEGARVAPPWLTKATAAAGAGLFLWARFALGRRFGIVPADRGIVDHGPYRLVRHPIYAASFLTSGAFVMEHFSLASLLLWVGGAGAALLKAAYEESFLSLSPDYGHYARTVRFRFVPGVI